MALVIHAAIVATVFTLVEWHYSLLPGVGEPLVAALTFAGIVALLNLAVATFVEPSRALFESVFGFWSPVVLVFCVTGIVAEFVAKPVLVRTE